MKHDGDAVFRVLDVSFRDHVHVPRPEKRLQRIFGPFHTAAEMKVHVVIKALRACAAHRKQNQKRTKRHV